MTATKPNGNGTSVWRVVQILLISAGAVSATVGGVYQIVDLKIQEQHDAEMIAVLTTRNNALAGVAEKNNLDIARIERDLREVETQFCAMDDERNLIHAHDVRDFATIYAKVFGAPYPDAPVYFPHVCNRGTDTK